MEEKKSNWIITLALLIVALSVINFSVILKFSALQQPKTCLDIPVKLVSESPSCTNGLLEAMNITKVKVVPAGTIEARRYEESILQRSSG